MIGTSPGNIDTIRDEVVRVFRTTALAGSNRAIDPTLPLGEAGMVIDSLALLQFITALENQFQVELPETLWTEHSGVTLMLLTYMIAELNPAIVGKSTGDSGTGSFAHPSDDTNTRLSMAESKGRQNKGRYPVVQRLMRKVYRVDNYTIIRFDLEHTKLPAIQPALPVTMRPGSGDDIGAVSEVWHPNERETKRALYAERLSAGDIALIAWLDNQAVGIDWITRRGTTEPDLGIQIALRPASCFGFDLNEHPEYRGKGIGMFLLCSALSFAKNQGFKFQSSIVHESNELMISASLHLLRFYRLGWIRSTTIFGQPHPTGEIEHRRIKGRVITL